MDRVTVIAKHVAKPGREAELEAALLALIAPTRAEKGFIAYDLHRDLDNPRVFVFYELWESRAHLNAHAQSRHLAEFKPKRGELIEDSMLHVLEQIG